VAYAIRPYHGDDAPALAQLCLAAIRQIGPHSYSRKQVEAWAARHPGARLYRERIADGAVIFVAADDQGQAAAYILIEPDGHVDRLYNHPQHTRRGLAARLLLQAEAHALSQKIPRLYTEASELARPCFERSGFTVTCRRNFEIAYEGKNVPIHNYAMEKPL